MKRAVRCARCNMRLHKCLCQKKKSVVKVDPEPRPKGQSTITWQCGPLEQLRHWRNNRQEQSSQDQRQAPADGENLESGQKGAQ